MPLVRLFWQSALTGLFPMRHQSKHQQTLVLSRVVNSRTPETLGGAALV